MSNMKKLISDQLEQDDDIVISPKLIKALSQVEIKYLLDNLISPDDLFIITKVQESLISLEDKCEYCCCKIKKIPDETCCTSKEIQAYLSRCEDHKLVKQFSSSSDDVKRIRETERRIQERKSSLSLSKFHQLQRRNESLAGRALFKGDSFDCHRGTLLRIQKKLENIRRLFPQLYSKNQSIIDVWAGSNYFDCENKDT